MAQQIQIRRDTATNWSSANPILAQGEMGLETNTLKVKFGDGVTAWNSLAYFGNSLANSTDVTLSSLVSGNILIANASLIFENKSLSTLVNELVSFDSLGSLAVMNQLSFTSLLNQPSLGSLAFQNIINYSQITLTPSLGSLAPMNQLSFTSLTNQPSLSSLAYQSTIDYTSAQLTNKPSLGSLAPMNQLSFTSLTNQPSLASMAFVSRVSQIHLPATASYTNLFVSGIQANSTASLSQIRSTGFITGTATMTELNSGVYNLYESGVQKAIFDGALGGRFRANASGETFLFENYKQFQLTDNAGQYMFYFDDVNMQFNNRDYYFNSGRMYFGTANATTITANVLDGRTLRGSTASIGFLSASNAYVSTATIYNLNVESSFVVDDIQAGTGYISILNTDQSTASVLNFDAGFGKNLAMFGGLASQSIFIDGPDVTYNRIAINNASTAVVGWQGYAFSVAGGFGGAYLKENSTGNMGIFTQIASGNPRVLIQNSNGYVGIADQAPLAVLEVNQTSTTAAVPPLQLVQADVSEEFINFSATAGAANALSTSNISTYFGRIRVGFNGVFRWIPVYNGA